MAYTYRCTEFPGMEGCPGSFTAATEEELWKHLELHGREAHGENPDDWSEQERRQISDLIRED